MDLLGARHPLPATILARHSQQQDDAPQQIMYTYQAKLLVCRFRLFLIIRTQLSVEIRIVCTYSAFDTSLWVSRMCSRVR